jgi:toxin ParE1/3/4
MISYLVRWTEPALSDLKAIHAFIGKENPHAADRVASRILEAVDALERFPNRGRLGPDGVARELVLKGWPWIVVYDVLMDEVQVLRVLHGAQERKSGGDDS